MTQIPDRMFSHMSYSSPSSLSSNGNHITVHNLSITARMGRQIVNNLSLTISPGTKLAIIGFEGAGKTTLMCHLAGELDPNHYVITGHVKRGTIGFLQQHPDPIWGDHTPLSFMLKENPSQDLDGTDNHLWAHYVHALQSIVEVKLSSEFLHSTQLLKTLSGGEYVRLRLAKIMMHDPDVILLDEPTNNLDLASVVCLEKFIQSCSCGIAFITHDETLIEAAAEQILFMQYIKNPDNQARHIYVGTNYSEFLQLNEKLIQESEKSLNKHRQQSRQLKKQIVEEKNKLVGRTHQGLKQAEGMADKNRVLNAATKGSQKVKKITQTLQRHQDQLMTILQRQHPLKLTFDQSNKLSQGQTVINFDQETLLIKDKRVIHNINLHVKGPQKIVITGQNGIGKTILLKKILNQLQSDLTIRVGYIPQKIEDVFPNLNKSAVAYLDACCIDKMLNRSTLIDYGFEREELTFAVGQLSSGQQIKLAIAMAILSKANILILDEPTNNLSPLSAPPLRQAIKDFPGEVIVVSHDRKLIELFDGHIYELNSQGLKRKIAL